MADYEALGRIFYNFIHGEEFVELRPNGCELVVDGRIRLSRQQYDALKEEGVTEWDG